MLAVSSQHSDLQQHNSQAEGFSKPMADPALQMTAERDCGSVLANMSLSRNEIKHRHSMICKKVHT